MNEAKSRVLNELRELQEKKNKLENFIFTEIFYDLDDEQQKLLQKQLSIMTDYSMILKRRLDIWKD